MTTGPTAPRSTAAGSRPRRVASGYTVVLPPGWLRISLSEPTERQLGEILAGLNSLANAADVRGRLGPYVAGLRRHLTDAVDKARQQGCLDLYLPVAPQQGSPVPASFVVSDSQLIPDVPFLVDELARKDPAMRPKTLDGVNGFRVERVVPPETGKGIDFSSRRVDYLLPVPGDYDRWLIFAFTTFGGGDPADNVARLLADLFDAIMATFRWEWKTA
jgi:hypothetical protein